MKKSASIFLVLVPVLFFTQLKAQTPHAPVSAGSSNSVADHSPAADSAGYKAARERDRENIRKAIKQGKENLNAIQKPNETLRNQKLMARTAIYALCGIIALFFYIRKKKKDQDRKQQ